MRENLLLILKGIIIGAGKIIPGVSGGMLAMTLGVYDRGVKVLGNFFKEFKNSFTFLLMLSIGMAISIVAISKIVKFSLDYYYLPTMLLFIGLIAGGIPSIVNKVKKEISVKNIIIMIIAALFIIVLSLISKNSVNDSQVSSNFVVMVLVGMVDAATMIIPGISGTAVLMILGYYDTVITAFSSVTNLSLFWSNMTVLIPFGIGLVLGTMGLAKLIDYLLDNYKCSVYAAIVGFAISSLLFLLKETFVNSYDLVQIIIGLFLLVLGYIIGNKLDDFN